MVTTRGALTYFLGINFRGYQIHFSDIALVGVVFAILFEVLMMIFLLESPYWLLNKNMEENTMQVLKSLRGEGYKVEEEVGLG